jgi:hypothetical protein
MRIGKRQLPQLVTCQADCRWRIDPEPARRLPKPRKKGGAFLRNKFRRSPILLPLEMGLDRASEPGAMNVITIDQLIFQGDPGSDAFAGPIHRDALREIVLIYAGERNATALEV